MARAPVTDLKRLVTETLDALKEVQNGDDESYCLLPLRIKSIGKIPIQVKIRRVSLYRDCIVLRWSVAFETHQHIICDITTSSTTTSYTLSEERKTLTDTFMDELKKDMFFKTFLNSYIRSVWAEQ